MPVSQARHAAARLPRGQLAVIPDCGHQPQVECPRQFLAAVGEFLDAARGGTPRRAPRVREEPA